jgi:hypothetical protein
MAVRIRFRDGVRLRRHYAFTGFDANGVSTKKWIGAHVPLLRRFFALNLHRKMFEVVDADAKPNPPAVVEPTVTTEITPIAGGEEADPLPATSLPAFLSPAEIAAEEAEDADQDERPRRRGRPPKVRTGTAEEHRKGA